MNTAQRSQSHNYQNCLGSALNAIEFRYTKHVSVRRSYLVLIMLCNWSSATVLDSNTSLYEKMTIKRQKFGFECYYCINSSLIVLIYVELSFIPVTSVDLGRFGHHSIHILHTQIFVECQTTCKKYASDVLENQIISKIHVAKIYYNAQIKSGYYHWLAKDHQSCYYGKGMENNFQG